MEVGTLLLSETGFSPYRVWFTSLTFAKEHPNELRAFTAASIRGWREYLEGDRSAADKRIGELNKSMVPDFIAFCVNALKQHQLVGGDPKQAETYGQIRTDRLEAEIHQLEQIGMIDKPVRVSDVFDGQFLPAQAK